MPRIGALRYGPPELLADRVDAFRQALREFGYIEGETVAIEWRVTQENTDSEYAEIAAEVVRMGADVIVTESSVVAFAAKQATSSIPIVAISVSLPVELGLVENLARPGGNVTAIGSSVSGLNAKRWEFLRYFVPGLMRVPYFRTTGSPASEGNWEETRGAAEAAGMTPQLVDLESAEDLDGAITAAVLGSAQAVYNGSSGLLMPVRYRFAELLVQHRLPAIDQFPAYADAGMLMAHGTKLGSDYYRRVASYVDRILKGAKRGDLPVRHPTEFDFVVNVKTAQALGISIPADVAAQVARWVQ